MEIIRKISTATLSAGHKLKGLDEEVYLGRIYGFAKAVEKIPTQYGLSDKFVGEFVASRVATDKEPATECMGPSCYLPSVVSNLIAEALAVPGNQGVQFGFDIYATPNEASGTGYEWKVIPLMEVKPSQGVLEFAKSFKVPRLASPKVEHDEKADEKSAAEPKADHKKGK